MRRMAQALVGGSVLGSLAFASGALAEGEPAFNLTGTYEGALVCDTLEGGDYLNFVLTEEPLRLVQDGDRFRMELFGFVYEGVLQEVKGSLYREAMAAICSNGVLLAQEIVRLRRISASGEEARFDAESILFQEFTEAVAPDLEGALTFDTCRWAYGRVSTEVPEVPECQFPGIRPPHEGGGG